MTFILEYNYGNYIRFRCYKKGKQGYRIKSGRDTSTLCSRRTSQNFQQSSRPSSPQIGTKLWIRQSIVTSAVFVIVRRRKMSHCDNPKWGKATKQIGQRQRQRQERCKLDERYVGERFSPDYCYSRVITDVTVFCSTMQIRLQ